MMILGLLAIFSSTALAGEISVITPDDYRDNPYTFNIRMDSLKGQIADAYYADNSPYYNDLLITAKYVGAKGCLSKKAKLTLLEKTSNTGPFAGGQGYIVKKVRKLEKGQNSEIGANALLATHCTAEVQIDAYMGSEHVTGTFKFKGEAEIVVSN
ncbi:MAG: hypothetical protein JNL01_08110 [Bdellovibrionales bacterium]|nr:hypothetical protein [Bdellovibrionales bacterium]